MSHTADQMFSFQGEGFAGFAWSTVNPQLVVAAVSQAYEGTLVSAQLSGVSYAGLYYSTDAGASWSLATINDSPGQDVQGPQDLFASPNGNSATAVVWNPVRHDVHRRGSFSRLLPVERRNHVDAHDSTAGQRTHCADVPHQPWSNRLYGMPHLSRRTRRQSAHRRYLRVDHRPQQSGSRPVAGFMLPLQWSLQQPNGCLFATMEHCVARDQHQPRKRHDRQWRLQSCACGRSRAAGHASASRRQRSLALQPRDGLQLAQHHQRNHLHERAGRSLPARAWPGILPTRRRSSLATTAGFGALPTPSARRDPPARQPMLLISKISMPASVRSPKLKACRRWATRLTP